MNYKRKFKDKFFLSLLYLSAIVSISSLFIILGFIFFRGIGVINFEFLTQMPRRAMTAGGIFPVIIGTFYLTLGAILFALPLGSLAAIYLTEYAKQNKLLRLIRIGINSLAGVPSVVFGLFGVAIFVRFFGFGVSLLSGSLTLGIMILPTIIRASEEAILVVPRGFREASLSLGATKRQTIWKAVLPSAIPGIITGSILGIGRAAGDTASILFTAVTFFTISLPDSIFTEVQALPFHIYALMTEGTHPEYQIPIAYGSALVLLFLVFCINLTGIIFRIRIRRRKKW